MQYLQNESNYLQEYTNDRSIYMESPYPLSLYKEILSEIKANKKYILREFMDLGMTEKYTSFYIRHDIDTGNCLSQISKLLDIDKAYNVKSGVYFRADDEEYVLADCAETVNKYAADGFEFGLHTVCYKSDNYFDLFEKELDYFHSSLGFAPKSFTVHGLGKYRLEIRMKFCNEVVDLLSKYHIKFTDCNENLRKYDYVLQDCHWNDIKKTRYLKDDVIKLPFPLNMKNYLFLTHPCYWI